MFAVRRLQIRTLGERRADAREAVDHKADQCAIAQPRLARKSIASSRARASSTSNAGVCPGARRMSGTSMILDEWVSRGRTDFKRSAIRDFLAACL